MENRRTTLLALVAVAVTLSFLWYANRPIIPPEATMDEVRAEAAGGGYRLINTEELGKVYSQPPANFLLRERVAPISRDEHVQREERAGLRHDPIGRHHPVENGNTAAWIECPGALHHQRRILRRVVAVDNG